MLMVGFIIVQIILLGIIVLVLRRLIFSDTNSAISRLTKLDNINREKQRQLSHKLHQAEKYVDDQRSRMAEQEERSKQEAKRSAGQLHDDIIKKAKEEADDVIRKATMARNRMKADAAIEAESKIIDFCGELLTAILSVSVQADLNRQLVAEFMTELEKAELEKVAHGISDVELISARNVPQDYIDKIKDILFRKLGRAIRVNFVEEPKILGGVMMKFGTIVVDASLSEKIKEVSQELKERLHWDHAEA